MLIISLFEEDSIKTFVCNSAEVFYHVSIYIFMYTQALHLIWPNFPSINRTAYVTYVKVLETSCPK